MSLPWSEKTSKAIPIVDDEVMILDSEDTDPDTINKRALLSTLPSSGQTNTASNLGLGEGVFAQKNLFDLEFKSLIGETNKIELAGNTDDITFTLGSLAVTTDKLNTYTAGTKQSFVGNTSSAGININNAVPSTPVAGDIFRNTNTLQYRGSSATRDIVDLSLPQTLTQKTMTASGNTFSGFTLGNEVTGSSSDLDDGTNIALLNAANIFSVSLESPIFDSSSSSSANTGIFRLANLDEIGWRNAGNTQNLLLSVDGDDFLRFGLGSAGFVPVTGDQGISGEVLTSNGVGSPPTFENAANAVFPVSDAVFEIQDDAVSSKRLVFELSSILTGTTRTITMPDADIILVSTSDGFITNSNLTSGSFTNITGVGTITTGTWNGTTIAVANGGTGATTFNTNGVLIGGSTIGSTSAGTVGEVLTSNGAGSPPTFEIGSSAEFFGPWTNTHDAGAQFLDDLSAIRDTFSNNIVTFTTPGSNAVNFITLESSNTGIAPMLGVSGSDTDIDLDISSQGAGNININGNLQLQAEITTITATDLLINAQSGQSVNIQVDSSTEYSFNTTSFDMNAKKIVDLATPTDPNDATNKEYVDAILVGNVTWSTTELSTSTTITDGVIFRVTAAPITVTIATTAINETGRVFIINDETGVAGDTALNNIVIDTEGSQTIDGTSSVSIVANYGSLRLYTNGTNLFSW